MEKSGNNARATIKGYQEYLGKIEVEVQKYQKSPDGDTSKIEKMVSNLTSWIEASKTLRKSGKGRLSFALFAKSKERRLNNITKKAIDILQSVKPESAEAEAPDSEWVSVDRPSSQISFEHQKALFSEYKTLFDKSQKSSPNPELQEKIDTLKESITKLRETLYKEEDSATPAEKSNIELLLQEITVTFGSHLENLTFGTTD